MTTAPSDTRRPSDAGAWKPIVGAIGPKVRDRRQQLGFSLQQLAQRAAVSAAAIHKVERGDMVPTITTLLKLAAALDRPIAHFVEDDGATAPVARFTSAAARGTVPAEATGVELAGISGPAERFRTAAAVGSIAPGATGGTRTRPGEDLVLVEEGMLEFEVGTERYTLRAGDALHYPTDRPHRWSNPGPGTVRMLWISVTDS